jgi:hypothetical protein
MEGVSECKHFFTTLSGMNKKKTFALTSSKSLESGVFPSPFTSSFLILEVKGEGEGNKKEIKRL